MKRHKLPCKQCNTSGAVQSPSGQIYTCSNCGGTGQIDRREISPWDLVFEYTIPAGGSVPVSVTILDFDVLAKWLVAYTATPTDKVLVTDNNGRQWGNAPQQLQNFAGSGQLPFPLQPNLLLARNTNLTITVTGTSGHTGEIVIRGIKLADEAES
jgi:hypothetical protein